MKTLTKALLCTGALTLIPLAFSTGAEKNSMPETELPEYKLVVTLPEATHQPAPQVKSSYVGMELELKFTVTADGRPEMVRLTKPLISYSDIHKMTFASQMRDLVALWKFEPAQDARGNPIAAKVKLPVEVVEKAGTPTMFAKLILDTGMDDKS